MRLCAFCCCCAQAHALHAQQHTVFPLLLVHGRYVHTANHCLFDKLRTKLRVVFMRIFDSFFVRLAACFVLFSLHLLLLNFSRFFFFASCSTLLSGHILTRCIPLTWALLNRLCHYPVPLHFLVRLPSPGLHLPTCPSGQRLLFYALLKAPVFLT